MVPSHPTENRRVDGGLSSSGGGLGGPSGSNNSGRTINGVPINRPRPRLRTIPDAAPDTDGGAQQSEPLDLNLLALENDRPRRTLINTAMAGTVTPQMGITGWSGVFIL